MQQHYVALFASAWIETEYLELQSAWQSVALFASAWIETASHVLPNNSAGGRALRERVD